MYTTHLFDISLNARTMAHGPVARNPSIVDGGEIGFAFLHYREIMPECYLTGNVLSEGALVVDYYIAHSNASEMLRHFDAISMAANKVSSSSFSVLDVEHMAPGDVVSMSMHDGNIFLAFLRCDELLKHTNRGRCPIEAMGICKYASIMNIIPECTVGEVASAPGYGNVTQDRRDM